MTQRRRVAITGLGAVTPVGNNVRDFWAGLSSGRSGLGLNDRFDTSQIETKVCALVKGFDPKDHLDLKLARQTEPFVQYALVAAREAWGQSGLASSGLDRDEIGCVIGCGIGGIAFIEESCRTLFDKGPRRITPFLVTKIIPNAPCGQVAIDLGLRGPNMAVITACAAGTNAIGEAAEMIRRGAATAMIAGGAESSLALVALAGFENMKALATGGADAPEKLSRPFDAQRSGFVMGEGAGILVLEDYDHAKSRGAEILAEVAGYGSTCDAFHMTAPSPGGEGGAKAMKIAVRDSGLAVTDIGYVNAHGTSTELNDKQETAAIKSVFGDHARAVAISSNKSMIGHLLGAAGGVEAVATVMTLRNELLPPTINLDNPDPECDLDYVPNVARPAPGLRAAMSNSLGFGGHNAVIILTRDQG